MKYIHVYALFLMFVFCASCKRQGKTGVLQANSKSEIKDTVSSYGPHTMVRNIKQAKDGTILITASFAGVLKYDGKSFTNFTSKLGPRRFWDVRQDRRGNIWIATTDSGVYCYNGKSFRHFTTREGLASNGVMCIYEDKAGMIWLGTGKGISRYDGKSFRNFTTKAGHWNNDITTITEDKTGKLWIGTRGEAFVYDGKTFTTITDEGKALKNIWGIIEDKKGNIWLGGNVGLWRYDGSTFTKVTQKGATAIIQDKKGNIWTTGIVNPPGGMVWALSRYDHKSLYNKNPTVIEVMSIKGLGMLCGILEANDGSIWFGALGPKSGVYRYDGKTITDFKSKEGQK